MSTSVAQSIVSVTPDRFSRRVSIGQFLSNNVVALNVATLAIAGVLVFSYIIQVNVTITKGYQMRDLETQLHELALVNEKIELDARRAQSLEHVTHAVKMLGFEKAEMPTYVQASAPSYALAE